MVQAGVARQPDKVCYFSPALTNRRASKSWGIIERVGRLFMKTVRRHANTKFVRHLNVMALMSVLGVMFAAAACQGRSTATEDRRR